MLPTLSDGANTSVVGNKFRVRVRLALQWFFRLFLGNDAAKSTMSSCPFRRQKSSSRLLEKSSNDAPVRQESMGVQNEEEEDTQTLNIKVLNEAVRLLTEPGVSLFQPFGRRKPRGNPRRSLTNIPWINTHNALRSDFEQTQEMNEGMKEKWFANSSKGWTMRRRIHQSLYCV